MTAKYIQKKGNVWYFRRRIKAGCGGLHRDVNGKPQTILFFSLKTPDQLQAAKRVNEHARRQDALWENHLNESAEAVDPKAALGRLEAAGLRPGDGLRHGDNPIIEQRIEVLTDGPYEPTEVYKEPTAQDKLTLDLLMGKQVPRTLSDARDKHTALGKEPRNKIGQQQFDRAWAMLFSINGDAIITDVRREQANTFVEKLRDRCIAAKTVSKWLCCTNHLIDSSCKSSVVASQHEQTADTPDLQDPELARLQRSAQAPRLAV